MYMLDKYPFLLLILVFCYYIDMIVFIEIVISHINYNSYNMVTSIYDIIILI